MLTISCKLNFITCKHRRLGMQVASSFYDHVITDVMYACADGHNDAMLIVVDDGKVYYKVYQ